VLQVSEDLILLHSGTPPNDVTSFSDITATELQTSESCQTKDFSTLK